MVESQCVASLILLDGALQEIVSNNVPIEEITPSGRHGLQYLHSNRIEELGWNNIQRRIGCGIDGGIALRRLNGHTLIDLVHQNSSWIIELAILIS